MPSTGELTHRVWSQPLIDSLLFCRVIENCQHSPPDEEIAYIKVRRQQWWQRQGRRRGAWNQSRMLMPPGCNGTCSQRQVDGSQEHKRQVQSLWWETGGWVFTISLNYMHQLFNKTTIRLMFILEILLRLKPKQGDVTCAFLHAILSQVQPSMLICLWALLNTTWQRL